MTEDVSLAKIKAIREVIEKNLEIVQQVLGVEAANDNDLSELQAESRIFIEEAIRNFPQTRLTASELAEEKKYLLSLRDTSHAQFLKNQAMFAENVAKFELSRKNFLKKRKIDIMRCAI